MMMKISLILSSIVAIALGDVIQLDNGQYVDVEFENQPVQNMFGPSAPYPYRHHPVVVEPDHSTTTQSITATEKNPAQSAVIVAEVTEPAGFISTAISCVLGTAKTVFFFVLKKLPALVAGTVVAIGVCKFTCLCNSEATIYEIQSDLNAIATPERLARAAEFVTKAVEKYKDLQK